MLDIRINLALVSLHAPCLKTTRPLVLVHWPLTNLGIHAGCNSNCRPMRAGSASMLLDEHNQMARHLQPISGRQRPRNAVWLMATHQFFSRLVHERNHHGHRKHQWKQHHQPWCLSRWRAWLYMYGSRFRPPRPNCRNRHNNQPGQLHVHRRPRRPNKHLLHCHHMWNLPTTIHSIAAGILFTRGCFSRKYLQRPPIVPPSSFWAAPDSLKHLSGNHNSHPVRRTDDTRTDHTDHFVEHYSRHHASGHQHEPGRQQVEKGHL
jgi:hypothetical protein